MSNRLLLVIAFIGFISLGLPDAVIGVAWPFVRRTFGLEGRGHPVVDDLELLDEVLGPAAGGVATAHAGQVSRDHRPTPAGGDPLPRGGVGRKA